MGRLIRALAAAAALAFAMAAALGTPAAATPDLEERLFTDAAQDEVAITATFSGSEIFVFGAVARSRFLEAGEPAPDIVVSLRGPVGPALVWKKDRVAGIWVNSEAVRIAQVPSYYAVASTAPLETILRDDEDRIYRISIDRAVRIVGAPLSSDEPEAFREAVIRLRRADDLYRHVDGGVQLKDATLYNATFALPANIVEGDYVVRVFLVREQRVLDQARLIVPVRKRGLERFLFEAAREHAFLYGVGALLTALLAGWGASEAFRRLRR